MFDGSLKDGNYEQLHKLYDSLNQESDDWTRIKSVLMPLYEGEHWSLMLVDMKQKTFYHLNSLRNRKESQEEFKRWVRMIEII